MIDALRSAPVTASMTLSYRQRASSMAAPNAPPEPTLCLDVVQGAGSFIDADRV